MMSKLPGPPTNSCLTNAPKSRTSPNISNLWYEILGLKTKHFCRVLLLFESEGGGLVVQVCLGQCFGTVTRSLGCLVCWNGGLSVIFLHAVWIVMDVVASRLLPHFMSPSVWQHLWGLNSSLDSYKLWLGFQMSIFRPVDSVEEVEKLMWTSLNNLLSTGATTFNQVSLLIHYSLVIWYK